MAERESRKRKATEQGEEYKKELAKSAVQTEQRKKARVVRKEIDTELSDLFGKMKASDEIPQAAMDVEMDMAARGRRRKTRKVSKKSKKKSRKTRKH